jgi:DNA-binding NtrC family response regulator
MKFKVLVVDDDPIIRNSLNRIIAKEGYAPILCGSGEEALDKVQNVAPDIVFLDLRLPGMDGLSTLRKIKEIDEDIIVILLSAYGTFETVVEAVKYGAFDYIQKPYKNEEIKINLSKAVETIRLKKEVTRLRYQNKSTNRYRFEQIIAKSGKMRDTIDKAVSAAKSSDTPVLIQGETGVGKEIVARTIHHNSPRRGGPFLTLNCGAIPKDIMESELFGYEKGAFTGADRSKPGLFELAENGTLLLDEIGELSGQGQVKLLRVLENKTFFKVGGVAEKVSDVRIIASTNKLLEQELTKKRFREDLYFRLNVIKIIVPPLRERRDDIIPLAKHFINIFKNKFNKKIKGLTPKAIQFLKNHEWPGNVREVRNLMERAVLFADQSLIDFDAICLDGQKAYPDHSFVVNISTNGPGMDEINRMIIAKALDMSNGNQVKAAKLIGLSRSSLRYRIKKYNIQAKSLTGAK